MNREPFGVGEWYHCYSRGVDKRKTFQSVGDYQRFLQLLYVANGENRIALSDLKLPYEKVFDLKRGKQLVSIGAYALMPNHFHLLLQEKTDGGIARFMQRLGTGYSMYFNAKQRRVGNVFVKPFRSRHVNRDGYFMHIANYIHFNAAELFESGWKSGTVRSMSALKRSLEAYPYSSLQEYLNIRRAENTIITGEAQDVLRSGRVSLEEAMKETLKIYQEISTEIAAGVTYRGR